MKKLLLSSMACLAFAGYANAQAPAEWQVGDDVTTQVGLGDCDGSFSGDWSPNDYAGGDVKTPGNYWKGSMPNEYREVENGKGVLAFYNQKEFDIYQMANMPAGSYTIKVQSYYREGNPNDTFTNWNNKGRVKKNVYLYASVMQSADPESEVKRDFNKLIRSMAQTSNTVSWYENSDLGWASDGKNTVTYGVPEPLVVYFPSCNIGNYYHLSQGFYPNEMKIVLSEDASVRLGIRKIASIPEDYVPLYNFQVIYNGPISEAAIIDAAREDCSAALSELEEFRSQLEDAGFEGFAGAVSDLVMGFEDEITGATSTAQLDEILVNINNTVDNYLKSLVSVNSLDELISMSTDMLQSTSFPGLETFQAAYDKAVSDAKTDDVEALGDDPGLYFAGIYQTLAEARANYLDSQEADQDGAKDFTALIKHPWFVNPEFTPTQNEDGTWTLKEETWNWGSVGNPADYSTNNGARTDICSKVILGTDASVNNQWYKRLKTFGNGWSANSFKLFYQAGLIGASQGWCSGFDDWEGVCQQLVGLPNGYYSLKALVRGNDADPWKEDNLPPYHNIFAENSEEVRVASIVGHTDGYYCQQLLGSNNGWYEWNPVIWQEHKTGTIQVNDGKLLIGGQSSMLANFTGFRLQFYGTTPPFTALIQKELDAIEGKKDGLFKGDIKAIDEILAQVKLPIPDADAYDAALAVILQANDYIGFAKTAIKNYTAVDVITAIGDRDYVIPAFTYVIAIGEGESDTYLLVEEANKLANAYKQYCDTYDKVTAIEDNVIADIVKEQTESMKAELKTAEQLQAYMDALSLPYNIALLAAAGAADATEANPANITSLIVNPSFTDSPTDGWSGETPTINEYGRGNAELWNKSAFTLSQKIAGLPAGTYELRAKAIYRDGGSVTPELVEAYNTAGSLEAWENHNAQLFAKVSDENDQFVYIKAIESLKGTGNSFTYVATAFDNEEAADGSTITFATKFQKITGTEIPVEEIYGEPAVEEKAEGDYPFDTKLAIGEETLYYPSSMQGFYQWCVKSPEAVANSVRITVENGDVLEIGIRKTAAISSDWVIFDDFELYYLTGETFKEVNTSVESIDAATKSSNSYLYNVAGQKVDKTYKGFVITKGKKVVKQ